MEIRENKTSMAYWLPRIEHLKLIPMPHTVLIPVKFTEDGECFSEETHKRVEQVTNLMGYPLFIKTDLSAGKHDYSETCYVESREKLHINLERLRDNNFCTDCFFGYIAVRRYIELDWKFKAFRGLPIAPERRYFIDEGKVVCRHGYWPLAAMEFYDIELPNDFVGDLAAAHAMRKHLSDKRREEIKPLLEEMNAETPQEINVLTDYAEMVARVLPGYWSVDFARGRNKKWYLIDMAEGDKSYHDDECIVRKMKDGLE